jgi:hypothetical protein
LNWPASSLTMTVSGSKPWALMLPQSAPSVAISTGSGETLSSDRDLKAYQLAPSTKRKAALSARFDRIFKRQTGFIIARLTEHRDRHFPNQEAWTAHLKKLGITVLGPR